MSIDEYWDSTLAELKLFFEAYYKREERRANEISMTSYSLAKMIAQFVGLSMNGKSIPSYETLYPQPQTSSTVGKVDEIVEGRKLAAYFWDYAQKHNAQRHKKLERVGEVN